MLNTNILGTTHILEVLREKAPDARFLLASTAYVYGNPPADTPVRESSPLRPNGIYAVSKAAADLMTLAYAQDYGMHAMTARAANHTGPGQNTDFVVPAFARQIAAIAAGETQPIHVGNLDSERSFMDVRDVVRAYRLLIESGTPGHAYNVAAPDRVPIRCILETLADLAGVSPRIVVDPDKLRPTDRTPVLDTALISRDTGWHQQYALRDTLREILYAIQV
jgi:GDP-4-dehydro-6-deoxy-D-mannose reductase